MSTLHKEGKNWVITTKIDFLDESKNFLDNIDKSKNLSKYTSSKGENSSQYFITNPTWAPTENYKEPSGWKGIKEKYQNFVKKELVYHCIFPWINLYAKSAWTVTGEKGSYHTVHDHGNTNISTVTYIKVPDNCDYPNGTLYFIMDSDCNSPISTPTKRILNIIPEEGMIVIFPSWLLHGVYPQLDGTRTTLNIDFNGNPNFSPEEQYL